MTNIQRSDGRHGALVGQNGQCGRDNDAEGDCQKNYDGFPFHCAAIIVERKLTVKL